MFKILIQLSDDVSQDSLLNTISVDPDHTAPKEQSDQGLHCLLMSFLSRYLGNLWFETLASDSQISRY